VRASLNRFEILMVADVAGHFLTATRIPRNQRTADTLKGAQMRGLKTLVSTAALLAGLALAPIANAQISINIGVQPVCSYGYYGYAPYSCAPMGYYGSGYFYNGIFLGMGPWAGWGYGHGWGAHRFGGDGGGSYHGGVGRIAYNGHSGGASASHGGGGARATQQTSHSAGAHPAAARPAVAHAQAHASTAHGSESRGGGEAHGGGGGDHK
jgi:hypothetical protein